MEARKKKKRSDGCGLDDKNKHLSADDQDESLCSLSLYAFPLCSFSALPPIKMQNSTQTVSSLQLHKGSQYFSFTPLPCLPTSLTAKWKVMQRTAPYASKSSLSGPLCSTEHIWSSCWMEHLIHPILFIISKAVPHIVCTVTVHQSQLSCLQAWYFPSPLLWSLSYAWLSIIHIVYCPLFKISFLSSCSHLSTSVFSPSMWVIVCHGCFCLCFLCPSLYSCDATPALTLKWEQSLVSTKKK